MLIELENASLSYQKGTAFEAVGIDAVSLRIEPGERVGVTGPTGSGKSTLLSILGGIVRPDSGRLLSDGEAVTGKTRVAAGRIGLALQSPEDSLFGKTVFDDIAFAPRNLGLGEEETRARVERSMVGVGLEPAAFGQRSPFSLSAGEQRRVALAGVLALEPEALLLDEPTAYLDPVTRRDILARLVALNEHSGMTIVIAGHDMDEMAVFASRLVVMDGGRKVADAPAAEMLADDVLLAGHGLEPPGTVRLCRLLAQRLGRPVAPVLSEAGAVDLLMEAARGEGMPCG